MKADDMLDKGDLDGAAVWRLGFSSHSDSQYN
jgi:hypothetical protein